MLTTALLDALVAGLVYAVFRRENDRSARLWVTGSLLMAAGFVMLVLRPYLPDVLAFAVTNFIMLYAMALYRDSFWCMAQPDFKPSPLPLLLCLGDGLLIWWLKANGFQAYLSFTAAVAWVAMHLWLLLSLNQLRRQISNPYFTMFMAVTGVGLVSWAMRVALAAGFNISMATDSTLVNLLSLSAAHLALIAQQIAYLVVRLTEEKSKKQKIQELSQSLETMWEERQKLLEARQQDREQLLRDVHDGFGSKLAMARMLAERGRLDPRQFAGYLEEITADLHLVVDTLSQNNLTFEEALADMRYRLDRRMSSGPVAMHWGIDLQAMPEQSPRTILHQLRIVQEAFNNAIRHANPVNITITARYIAAPDRLELTVVDDGTGLGKEYRRGQGINNMLSRAREIGGHLEIKTLQPGVAVCLTVPLVGQVSAHQA